ncbi:Clan MH, family M18, aspartyl aminopeptidase-like metallopeptidase [Trichomonas vaginalis G3]|uniref:aspartyl aminopeptidase n=1 Tax=Trichomonas vaginalis (strain ATCC PRA-98 / G3) TaxID=412133 RepID=A2DWU2_TRIV3|nr:aminopeptidase protein [Trichomonas vaginalis G3]EAY15124.1 Clan MH, family M18, aspartyl aminopeptidase-like metallopeptidase [Trichomonas vaginalis G3]KAI5499184.1 aminopeptidase protein [Trichomonas vaginalis G3]|eukprot:XP_001327347.1 Clan MH, family M18, aspartyl aminopeptidase-like metallopeptidase [Trichomonas vaginalis G3]
MTMQVTAEKFIDFIDQCPFPFQFCNYARGVLTAQGYTELQEQDEWKEIPAKGFFIRDHRALVAWNRGGMNGAVIVGTHDDSPCFKVQPNQKLGGKAPSVAVTTYGGGLWKTFMDRELRCAGIVYEQTENGMKPHLYDSKRGIAFIPSKTCIPIIGADPSIDLIDYVAKEINIDRSKILSYELGFVDARRPSFVGTKGEFVASERIDNLGSTFCGLEAFINSTPKDTFNVLVVFDHEEIGSDTHTGARSNLLESFFRRVIPKEDYEAFIAKSYLVSSDNAHAWHPNYQYKHEDNHRPLLAGGPVIKRSPGRQYATDLTSVYPFVKATELCGVPYQVMMNRNDIPSGSTIGPFASAGLGIATIDIGQPQLAMHSIREFIAAADFDLLIKVLKTIYERYDECRLDQ